MTVPSLASPPTRPSRASPSPRVQFLLAWVVVGLPFIAANAVTRLWMDTPALAVLRNPFKTAVLLVAYALFVRYIEQRRVTELSGPRAPQELGLGFAWGFGLITAAVGLLALQGGYRVSGWASPAGMVQMLGLHLFVAVLEEVLFRALLLRLLEKMLGTWLALALSTALFCVAHLANPEANALTLGSLGVLSVCLSLAFLATRRLWLCVGLHWAWNFAQGGLFSLPVSGNVLWPGLLAAEASGPSWATGGAFGIEASVFTLALTLLAAGHFLRQVRRSGALAPEA